MRAVAYRRVTALGLLVAAFAPGASARAHPVALRWLRMVDQQHGYALSGQDVDRLRLLRTGDGGRRWVDITPGRGSIRASLPVGVYGRATLLLGTRVRTGVFAVERSDDGGRSWQRSLPLRDAHGLGIGQPMLLDRRHLYVAIGEGAAAGSEGEALYTSADGGHNWHFVSRTDVNRVRPGTLPFGCDKNGFGFATASRGWAGGYCAGGAPFFYRTDNGGRSWRRRPLPGLTECACEVSAPLFFTPHLGAFWLNGFTMNGGGKPIVRIYWTSDGGNHWRGTEPTAGRSNGVASFADAHSAWLTATRPGRIGRTFTRLVRTDDAGRSWQTTTLPFNADGYQLDALSATVAYAVRSFSTRTTILLTRDGGRRWQTIATHT